MMELVIWGLCRISISNFPNLKTIFPGQVTSSVSTCLNTQVSSNIYQFCIFLPIIHYLTSYLLFSLNPPSTDYSLTILMGDREGEKESRGTEKQRVRGEGEREREREQERKKEGEKERD